MTERTCIVDGCDRAHSARGWCRRHYDRWARHGDPLAGYRSPGAPIPPCAVEGCTRATKKIIRGWCVMHYSRWTTTGELGEADGRIHGDDLARFTAGYVVDAAGCWLWQRSKNGSGYGAFFHDGRTSAHAWSYEHHVGPVPDGYEIDHLCAVRACVNPAHLEAVTHEENLRRMRARRPDRARRRMEALLRFAADLGHDPLDPVVQAIAITHSGADVSGVRTTVTA